MKPPTWQPLSALALLSIGLVATAWLAPLMGPSVVLWTYAACFLPYAFLARTPPSIGAIIAAAFAARLVVAFAEPLLSDDIFRYVWEGRVTLAGHNPFASPPDAPELVALRDEAIWPRVNHPHISTIYPPISQAFFAAVAAVGGGLTAMRLAFVAVECAGVIAVWRLAGETVSRRALVLYALNPLVVLEVAWSGHLDVLAWTPLVVALAIVELRGESLAWSVATGVLVGVSIGAKFLGVILLPYLLFRRGVSNGRTLLARLVLVGCAATIVAASYVGYIDAGSDLFRGFGTYAASWRNNDGPFRAVAALTERALGGDDVLHSFSAWDDLAVAHGFTKEWEGQTLPDTTFTSAQIAQTVAKAVAALAVGVALLGCIFLARDPFVAALVVLGTLYFLAPTVHPWYVAWLVPIAALRPSPTALGFSCAVLVGYVSWWSSVTGGPWAIPSWAVGVEYSIVAALAVWEVWARPHG